MQLTFEQWDNINIPSFENLPIKLSEKPDQKWQQDVQDALEWVGLAYIKANRYLRNGSCYDSQKFLKGWDG